jgi:hypothetical protein
MLVRVAVRNADCDRAFGVPLRGKLRSVVTVVCCDVLECGQRPLGQRHPGLSKQQLRCPSQRYETTGQRLLAVTEHHLSGALACVGAALVSDAVDACKRSLHFCIAQMYGIDDVSSLSEDERNAAATGCAMHSSLSLTLCQPVTAHGPVAVAESLHSCSSLGI